MFSRATIAICMVFIGIGVVQCAKLKRGVASGVGGDIFTTILGHAASEQVVPEVEEGGCALSGGCTRGYCWAGCDATVAPNEWCYTTQGFSQDFKYVPCSNDGDCNRCWKCAGSCTV